MRTVVPSPVGPLYLETTNRGITALLFSPPTTSDEHQIEGAEHLRDAESALRRYFAGDGSALNSLVLDPVGTEFQRDVWRESRNVAFGTTVSYGELARRIGRADSSRAVGAALGANPICIIYPCHRILSATGKLHGFSGGLAVKEKLLRHEGAEFIAGSPASAVADAHA